MNKRLLRISACILLFIFTASIQPMSMNIYAAKDGTAAGPASSDSAQAVQEPVASSGGKVETERKFLIDPAKLPKDIDKRGKVYDIVQTYINYSPEMRVRMLNKKYYYFTLKRPLDDIGLSREETEFRITQEEYESLVKKREGNTIYKTRYQFYENGTYIFVDVYYSKKLKGLAVAEVEFPSVAESNKFIPPKWFGKEITSDKRYKNANLAKDGMPKDEKTPQSSIAK